MNLYHLRVFKTVAEHEHITRALQELILSQPAVTKIIQSLEQDTGLEREMEEALTVLRDVETGSIKLAANTTTGVYLLPQIVSRYRNLYPRVTLNITILNSSEIIEQTLNWTLDFGLVEGDPTTLPTGLHVEVFAQDELVLVVSPDHRWSKLDELHPEALREGELLIREQGSGIREVIEHTLMLRGVQVHPLLTLSDNEVIKQMVISGVGAAIVSSLTVRGELMSGDLVRLPIAGVDLRPQLHKSLSQFGCA
jgi:DNA-binding transcriptional LysR family regulator